jgi:hypothetical protein
MNLREIASRFWEAVNTWGTIGFGVEGKRSVKVFCLRTVLGQPSPWGSREGFLVLGTPGGYPPVRLDKIHALSSEGDERGIYRRLISCRFSMVLTLEELRPDGTMEVRALSFMDIYGKGGKKVFGPDTNTEVAEIRSVPGFPEEIDSSIFFDNKGRVWVIPYLGDIPGDLYLRGKRDVLVLDARVPWPL